MLVREVDSQPAERAVVSELPGDPVPALPTGPTLSAPWTPTAPTHIALIGSSSAGKTTLARAIVQACGDRGTEAWLSEDFASRHIGVHWIGSAFVRRRAIELASLVYALATWRRYRDYHRHALRIIREAPGSWLYRAGLVRLTLRKTGIHEMLRRGLRNGQVVISDNEATLQGAHHLFVHPQGTTDSSRLGTFAALAPMPDVVVYVRTQDPLVVERMLRRSHPRLGSPSVQTVEETVRQTSEVFDRLCGSPAFDGRLLVVYRSRVLDVEDDGPHKELRNAVAELVSTGMVNARRGRESKAPHGRDPSPSTELAKQLLARLDESVAYCQVKSDHSVARDAADSGTLDLLVDPSGVGRATTILADMGFREAVDSYGPRPSSVWNYYGCDTSTGTMVHVRLFSRLSTEESFSESHRLPIADMLLENTEHLGAGRRPTKAAELVYFVLRTFTRYGSVLDVARLARDRKALGAEFRWIESGCSIQDALALLERYCPQIDEGLFLGCVSALHNDASLGRRILLARHVRRRLAAYAVLSPLGRLAAYVGFLTSWFWRKSTGRTTGKVWHSGGAVIAFVGPDATGKSTLVGETARWLRNACPVEVAHLGKPGSSPWTLPLNMALGTVRALRGRRERWKPDAEPRQAGTRSPRVGWSSLLYALRAIVLAFDRRRAVRRTWLSATRGGVVVCDRYPTSVLDAMDGPRLRPDLEVRGLRSALYARLARLEHRLYRDLPQPDVLIRLTVSIETAQRRNRARDKADKHTEQELESRHQSLGSWATRSDRCRDVSTEGSLEETLSRLKPVIWELL